MQRLTISVIIPVYNGEEFLAAAVESARAQSLPPEEIIIVDDGSSDGTADVAARFTGNVRYVRQDNGGAPVARNTGLALATGDLIGLLDADDLWPQDRMAQLLPRLVEDPSLQVALGRMQLIRGAGGAADELETLTDPVTGLYVGCALFRRSAFELVGSFDPSLRFTDDLDWFLRALERRLPMVVSPSVVALLYRLHGTNMTRDQRATYHGIIAALGRSLARRREAGGGQAEPLAPVPGCGTFDETLRQTILVHKKTWMPPRGRRG